MKPTIILTVICAIVAALLIYVFNLTYVDKSGVITSELSEALTEIYGSSDDFEILMTEDNTVCIYSEENCVIVNGGKVAVSVTADGYNKNGVTALVGFDGGVIVGVDIVSVSETPGVGTKVNDKSFLSQFIGIKDSEYQMNAISGATKSSNGIKKIIDEAQKVYNLYMEAE